MNIQDMSQKLSQVCPLCGAKPVHLSIAQGKLLPLSRFLIECKCCSGEQGIAIAMSEPLSEEERQEAFREAMQMIRNIEFMTEEN